MNQIHVQKTSENQNTIFTAMIALYRHIIFDLDLRISSNYV